MKKFLSKLRNASELFAYYLFVRISSGILFVLSGSVGLAFGCTYNVLPAIITGIVMTLIGVVLFFIRETRYIQAVNEIEMYKTTQRNLKQSIRELKDKSSLLEDDIEKAQKKLKKFQSMKMVDCYIDYDSAKHIREKLYSVGGKFGPAFVGQAETVSTAD